MASMLRSMLKCMPQTIAHSLKFIAYAFEPLAVRLGIGWRMPARDWRNPFFGVSSSAIRSIELEVLADRLSLLQIGKARQMLAQERMRQALETGQVARVAEDPGDVAHNSLGYNLETARAAAGLDRPMVMVKVVSAIERVHDAIEQLDVLSIGPRSEIEIFAIMSAGFSPDRIRAIDLFSYSPYVDVGDAHHMPYADNSFDILFLGWVLPYSRNQKHMAEEIIRVCRNGAIVAVAADYSDPNQPRPEFNNESTAVTSTDAVLDLFANNYGSVYFRHDPDLPNTTLIMTVFEISK